MRDVDSPNELGKHVYGSIGYFEFKEKCTHAENVLKEVIRDYSSRGWLDKNISEVIRYYIEDYSSKGGLSKRNAFSPLEKLGFTEEDKDFFQHAVETLSGEYRYNKTEIRLDNGKIMSVNNPYAVHNGRMMFISKLLLNDNAQLAFEVSKKSAMHESLDIAAKYCDGIFMNENKKISKKYPDAVNSSIILAGPEIFRYIKDYNGRKFPDDILELEKLATMLMVKKCGNLSDKFTYAIDKLDNEMNLEYLENKTDGKDRMAHWFVSIAMLAAEEFENELGDFGKKLIEYSTEIMKDREIPPEIVEGYVNRYKQIKEKDIKFIDGIIEKHVKQYGFIPYGAEGKIKNNKNKKSKFQIFKSLFQRAQTS